MHPHTPYYAPFDFCVRFQAMLAQIFLPLACWVNCNKLLGKLCVFKPLTLSPHFGMILE